MFNVIISVIIGLILYNFINGFYSGFVEARKIRNLYMNEITRLRNVFVAYLDEVFNEGEIKNKFKDYIQNRFVYFCFLDPSNENINLFKEELINGAEKIEKIKKEVTNV